MTLKRGEGPLPKSDSVQFLASLVSRSLPAVCDPHEGTPVRGLDANAHVHEITVNDESESVGLSGLGLATVELTPLQHVSLSALREVSLAANVLESVDLTGLEACTSLAVLTLNNNKLTTIDLGPLAKCKALERLWLHDNKLQSIDLSPLEHCTALRSLYLEDNAIHRQTVNLSPLVHTKHLRSLRIGGNELAGVLDVTPLLSVPALSVFNYQSSVKIVAAGNSSQARVSPAMRRIVLDIHFANELPRNSGLDAVKPPRIDALRMKINGSSTPPKLQRQRCAPRARPLSSPAPPVVPINALLVGFRRISRYSTEDALSTAGKVALSAASEAVASHKPAILLDADVVLLHAPSQKTLREVLVVLGRNPLIVLGTENYRVNACTSIRDMLQSAKFCTEPLGQDDASQIIKMATHFKKYGVAKPDDSNKSMTAGELTRSYSDLTLELGVAPISGLRKSILNMKEGSNLPSSSLSLDPISERSTDRAVSQDRPLSQSNSDGVLQKHVTEPAQRRPYLTWSEVSDRLQATRERHNTKRRYLCVHGANKLSAERAAVECAFSDLGGYVTPDNCIGIARSCGLPKCAGQILFRAVINISSAVESTTPEPGTSESGGDRKIRTLSRDGFLAYWEGRLKKYNCESRLCNVIQDGRLDRENSKECSCLEKTRSTYEGDFQSHELIESSCPKCGSIMSRKVYSSLHSPNHQNCNIRRATEYQGFDESIRELVASFMKRRCSRFGAFALVKMSEAIAIGVELLKFSIRSENGKIAGSRSLPITLSEIRESKLCSSLIAAEAGIFDGVSAVLSMDKIRIVKGHFTTEASPLAVSLSDGLALNYSLKLTEVQRYNAERKLLLPIAVESTLSTHCRRKSCMTLSEFATLHCALSDLEKLGSAQYFFSVVDVDQDEYWSLLDVRSFYVEKEKVFLKDGMAVSNLEDVWTQICDMARPRHPQRGISRKEFCKLSPKDRQLIIQSLLFLDDDKCAVNIRKTMELNHQSESNLCFFGEQV